MELIKSWGMILDMVAVRAPNWEGKYIVIRRMKILCCYSAITRKSPDRYKIGCTSLPGIAAGHRTMLTF